MVQVAALVHPPAALRSFLVLAPVHLPSLGRTVLYQNPAEPVLVLPPSGRPWLFLVPLPPRLLESVPSPVDECRQLVELVISPIAPDPVSVGVSPMVGLRPPAQLPAPWRFPDGSFVQSLLVGVPIIAPLF